MSSPARTTPQRRPRVLVVGSGFAGFHCMRRLEKHLPADAADLVLASSADYLLYSPLLPNVASGVVESRHIAVGLHAALRRARVLLGHVVAVDVAGHTATLRRVDGSTTELSWDRLVLTPGGVTRTFDIPGVAAYGLGLKTLAEAAYLRDHVLRELESADAADDPGRRQACCTFVVVGAGYSGTETAAQMQLVTSRAAADYPRLRPEMMRWVLVDQAPRVLPELGRRLGDAERQDHDRSPDRRGGHDQEARGVVKLPLDVKRPSRIRDGREHDGQRPDRTPQAALRADADEHPDTEDPEPDPHRAQAAHSLARRKPNREQRNEDRH